MEHKDNSIVIGSSAFSYCWGSSGVVHHNNVQAAHQKRIQLTAKVTTRVDKLASQTKDGQVVLNKGESVKNFESDLNYSLENSNLLDDKDKTAVDNANFAYSLAKEIQKYFIGDAIQQKFVPAEERVLKDSVDEVPDFSKVVKKAKGKSIVNYAKELQETASEEIKLRKSADDSIKKLYKDNKVISTDQKSIDEATRLANEVKSPSLKKALLDQVAKVNVQAKEEKRVAQEQEAQRQAEAAEAARQAEAQAKEQAKRPTTSSSQSASSSSQSSVSAPEQRQSASLQASAPAVPSAQYTIGGYSTVALANSQAALDGNRYGWFSMADIPTAGGVAILGHADGAGVWVAGSSIGDIVSVG